MFAGVATLPGDRHADMLLKETREQVSVFNVVGRGIPERYPEATVMGE